MNSGFYLLFIWDARIPSKVKFCFQRACRYCLPTKSALLHGGIWYPCAVCCVVKQRKIPDIYLPLVNMLDNIGLRLIFDKKRAQQMQEPYEFIDWFFDMVKFLSETDFGKFAMVIYNLVPGATSKTAALRDRIRFQEGVQWQPPGSDFVKCNLDAALLLVEKRWPMPVLFEALNWSVSLGYQFVKCESDAKCVVDAVLGFHEDLMEFGSIIVFCRRLLQEESNFKVKFI
ncbi:hypothetical protein PTKIN_Ptkin08bG0154800 [Pterospermum kingtungense]